MTRFPFIPSTISPPQFQPTLDGQQYLVEVDWELFGERYYVRCSTIQGVLIFFVPLIESPGGLTIQSMAWNELTGYVEGETLDPHGVKIGATRALTVSGATPDVYNGRQLVLATGPATFEYPLALATDPGPATIAGALSHDINMAGGYFASTLVYRNGAFEVSP